MEGYGQNYGAYGGGGNYASPSNFAPSPMGGGAQGGFMMSDSPASQKGVQSGKQHSLTPCTVRQLLNAKQSHGDDLFRVDGVEIGQVTIVGVVLNTDNQPTHINFELEDGTGTIGGRVWKEGQDEDNYSSEQKYQWQRVGTYVRAVGNVRSFGGQRSLVSFKVIPITDYNEITYHFAEVIKVHLNNTAGFRGNAPAYQQNVHQVSTGIGGMSVGQSPYASASHFAPQQHGAYGNQNGDPAAVMMQIIRMNNSEVGADLQYLIDGMHQNGHPLPAEQIKAIANQLLDDGALFTTLDENHWKATEDNM